MNNIVRKTCWLSMSTNNKQSIVFAHSNGFHKGMWTPVIEDLASIIPQAQLPNLQCMAFDFQGHGDRGRTSNTHSVDLDSARDWLASTKKDVVDATACLSPDAACRVGVGASLGGAALVLAQLENPDMFTHLVLIEPVLMCLKDDGKTMTSVDVQAFHVESSYFEQKARKRRDEFASLAEAETFFSSRVLWERFDARAVKAYVEGGLVSPKSNGVITGPLSLRCPPEYEAEVYLTVPILSPTSLRKLSDSTDVTLCVGGNSTFTLSGGEEDGGALTYYGQNILPAFRNGSEMVVLEECSHHAAMERPMDIAKLVRQILSPSTDNDKKKKKQQSVQPVFVRD